jgi:hypothetical protein
MNLHQPSLTRRVLLGGVLTGAMLQPKVGMARPLLESGPVFKLSKGINFHHMLNWPAARNVDGKTEYVWPPYEGQRYATSDHELVQLRLAGFDFIRLTTDPGVWLASDANQAAELARTTHSLVERLIGAGFNVILDLHPIKLNPEYAPLRLVAADDDAGFKAYVDIVRQFATTVRDIAPDRIALELMNEPPAMRSADLKRWPSMLELLHAGARTAAPHLPLVLTGSAWSSHRALIDIDPTPFRDSDVLFTFHFYEPEALTHQGVANLNWQYIRDLSWPAKGTLDAAVSRSEEAISSDQTLDDQARSLARTRTRKILTDYFAIAQGPGRIQAEFAKVARWASRYEIPAQRILLGEFGCVRPQGDADDGWLQWLAAVREAAESNGFAWSYWAYKGWGGMSLVDDEQPTTLSSDVVGALGLRMQ